jgi:hypothetical protein
MAADTSNRPDMAPGAVPGLTIPDVRHAVEEPHLRVPPVFTFCASL